jgi:hypothetical protein
MGVCYRIRATLSGWRFPLLAATFAVLWSATPAFPWGCEGHRTIALIALKQLGPGAFTKVHQLLQGQPSDPTLPRLCPPSHLDPFVDVSTWADDIRDQRPETAPWHFMDIPLKASRNKLSDFCSPAGCVTRALQQQLDLLRSGSGDRRQQVEALMFVIHFVGDLHQPLHTTTNNDRGANCLPVTFFGTEPTREGYTSQESAKENYHPNLHGIWDTGLIQRIQQNQTLTAFANRLSHTFASQIAAWQQEPSNLDDWAWESHQAAVTTAYGKLPQAVSPETPQPVRQCSDDHHVSTRLKNLHEKVSAQYLHDVTPVIEQQLAKAGSRLAMLLNQLWP